MARSGDEARAFLLRGWREPAERRRWGAWNEIYEGPLFRHLGGRLKFEQFINFLRVSVPSPPRHGLFGNSRPLGKRSLPPSRQGGFLLNQLNSFFFDDEISSWVIEKFFSSLRGMKRDYLFAIIDVSMPIIFSSYPKTLFNCFLIFFCTFCNNISILFNTFPVARMFRFDILLSILEFEKF